MKINYIITGFLVATTLAGLVGVGSLFVFINFFSPTGASFVGGGISYFVGFLVFEFYRVVHNNEKENRTPKERKK